MTDSNEPENYRSETLWELEKVSFFSVTKEAGPDKKEGYSFILSLFPDNIFFLFFGTALFLLHALCFYKT